MAGKSYIETITTEMQDGKCSSDHFFQDRRTRGSCAIVSEDLAGEDEPFGLFCRRATCKGGVLSFEKTQYDGEMILRAFAVTLLVATAIHAQGSTLAHLSKVRVLVQFLPPDEQVLTKRFGLDQSVLLTETELRLREAGLSVGDNPDDTSLPAFTVAIGYAGASSVSLQAKLQEWGIIQRNSVKRFVTTWDYLAFGEAAKPEIIREGIRNLVSKFLNDWLADNPKRSQ